MSGWRWLPARRKVADRRLADGLTIQRDVMVDVGEPPLLVDLIAPRIEARKGPTIVSVHGFGGGRHDLTTFAFALALEGASVCNVGWRGYATGHGIETSLRDIGRAVHLARLRWDRPVTLMAWADGTLPAAVVALDGSSRAAPTAFVGLGGYYGWNESEVPRGVVNDRTIAIFGGLPSVEPARWELGNPYRYLGKGHRARFSLVVGSQDLQLLDSIHFHDALVAAGSSAQLEVIDGCGHFEVIMPRHEPGQRALDAVLGAAREAVR